MKLEALPLPFWLDTDRAGAPPDQLDSLERDLALALPQELRNALLLRDGGTSTYSSYRRDATHIPLPAFLSIEAIRHSERHRNLFATPPGILVIASGAHDWLGLDYRHGPIPRVVYQETEDSPLEPIADSFDSLLDGLNET